MGVWSWNPYLFFFFQCRDQSITVHIFDLSSLYSLWFLTLHLDLHHELQVKPQEQTVHVQRHHDQWKLRDART